MHDENTSVAFSNDPVLNNILYRILFNYTPDIVQRSKLTFFITVVLINRSHQNNGRIVTVSLERRMSTNSVISY